MSPSTAPRLTLTPLPGKGCPHVAPNAVYGGKCYRCDTILCVDCAKEYIIPLHPDYIGVRDLRYPLKGEAPILSQPIIDYLKTEGLTSGRVLITLCPPCTTELETKYLNSIPYEDLPPTHQSHLVL